MAIETRGRALVLIDERFLHDLLGIPDGFRVLGTTFDPLRLCVVVHLEGDALLQVPQGEIAPVIEPVMRRERRMNDALEWESRTTIEWPLPSGETLIGSSFS